MEFSIHSFPVQNQSQGFLENANVSWKPKYFPFDFVGGGEEISRVLSGLPVLVLVDGTFLPHILPSSPGGTALADLPFTPALQVHGP